MSNGIQIKLLKHSFGLVLLIFQYPLPGYITATAVRSTLFFHRENTARSSVFFFSEGQSLTLGYRLL